MSATPVVGEFSFISQVPVAFESQHAQAGVAGVPTVVNLAPPNGRLRNTFSLLLWSYDAVPVGGQITITDGASTLTLYVTNDGPGFLPFEGITFAENTQVTITLSSGGATVTGSLVVVGARSI